MYTFGATEDLGHELKRMQDSSAECDHTMSNKGNKMQHTKETTGILIP